MPGPLELLSKLRKGISLEDQDLRYLPNLKAEPVQQGAILAGLMHAKQVSRSVKAQVASGSESLAALYKLVQGDQWRRPLGDYSPLAMARWGRLFRSIVSGQKLNPHDIRESVADIVTKTIPDEFVGAFLMLVCRFGLQDRDVFELTRAMLNSGEEFDYRKDPRLRDKRLFRRYPTGGVSEKAALILPSLIAAIAQEVPVISPFLVGRSLGFTGGTWDKLSSIPGFRFPEPGPETIDVLVRCGVAMTVTHGPLNPADRILYQMRSVTDTIQSDPLIISSIVSKQIGVPCDLLILDVRYGPGAFLATRDHASKIGDVMCDLMGKFGVKCLMTLLDTQEPNGATIGNALEVSEAITIMKVETKDLFDIRMQNLQMNIVIDFAAKGMSVLFPERPVNQWAAICYQKFMDGDVWRYFKRLLSAHSVDKETIDELEDDSLFLLRDCQKREVKAGKTGQILAIDQEALGRAVNFTLGGGGNEYAGSRNLFSGIVLQRKLHDFVRKGDLVAYVMSKGEGTRTQSKEIAKAFAIR